MSEAKGTVSIVTPEGAELTFPLATVLERLLAFSFDLLLVGVATVLCVLAGAALTLVTRFVDAIAVIFLGLFAIRQGYFLFFEARWQGMTPGKRLMGLRVLSRDGGKLTMESIVARNVMRDLEIFVPMAVAGGPEQLVGRSPWWISLPAITWVFVVAILPVLTRDRVRAGDLVGGTLVVRIPKAALLRDEAEQTRAPEILFEREHFAVYGEHELETLASLLREIETGRARPEDLRLVAETIAKKVGFEGREPTNRPELFLREFYRQQRAELEKKLVLGRRKASKFDRG